MKSLQSKKWLLAAIGFLLILLILKIILFLTASPKVTINYLAEYNGISQPENYNSNENAAPYYQKAFDVFVEMPDELEGPWNDWHTDYLDFEQAMLESWVASNTQAFEYFRTASRKPYFWLERNATEDGRIITVTFPNLFSFEDLAEAITWNAKLNVIKKHYKYGFNDILACYRAGSHICNTHSFMIEQSAGLKIKQNALAAFFEILNRVKVDSQNLQLFQNALETEILKDKYVPDFEAERLLCYDELQRSFVYNDKGTGRLAFRKIGDFLAPCGEEYNNRVFLSCFVGPTRNEMVKRIEEMFALFEPVRTETPWQLHTRDPNYFKRFDILCYEDFFLGWFVQNPSRIFQSYHQTKAREQALLTVLAILRFEADKHRLPAALVELTDTGYLNYLPMDPYSYGPLVYTPTEDNFTLYSVGEDFVDDGGTYEIKAGLGGVPLGGYVRPSTHAPDIVYWPCKNLIKMLSEHLIETEKVRKRAVRKLCELRNDNAEPDEINQLKEEWWEELESTFAKYPEEYPDVNRFRRYKEDWWGVVEKDANKLLESEKKP